MRPVCLAALCALAACARATVIGTPCSVDRDCNVPGQRCVPGVADGPRICTHACTGQAGPDGCPVGYDCGPVDATRPSDLTCNKETYAFDAVTGAPLLFGKNCSLAPGTTQAEWDEACAASGDPAPDPTCRHARDPDSQTGAPLRNDPEAYCTGGCARDSDCPVDMQCALDYDGRRKCLRRGFCDPCFMNDNCVGEFDACVPTADGTARYCSKACGGQPDCGGLLGTFLACADATDSRGRAGLYCLHKFGACVGAGEVCDPCRSDADCGQGTRCVLNGATGERMCTKACTTDAECAASNKPTGCDFGPPPTQPGDPFYTDECTGDAAHQHPGALSCFF